MKYTKPSISVVVCTYNRGRKIRKCLDALVGQSLPQKQFEIIVVNDGSTDDTRSILEGYDGITVITNSPNRGLGESRNIGARASKADIIAFTDDDCVADRDWLRNLLNVYADLTVTAVGGKIIPYRTDKLLLQYYEANNPLAHVTFPFNSESSIAYTIKQYVKRSFSLKELPNVSVPLFMVVGANMSVRRVVFDEVGGFDASIKFGGEEEDFWKRLLRLNPKAKLLYEPRAVIGHDYDPQFKDAARRNYKYGVGAARTYFNDKSRLPVIYPFPFIVLTSLLLVIVSPFFLIGSLALAFVLYSGWVRGAVRRRKPVYIYFAGVQFYLELINSLGFLIGTVKILQGNRA